MPAPSSGVKTRNALLAAAKSFLGEGKADVSIQEIAGAAGVSVGSVYTYFPDKRLLFEAAAADAVMNDAPELTEIVGDFEDSALGVLAGILYASKRPSFAPQTSRIILAVGPLGFAHLADYFEAPRLALTKSVKAGLAKCEDIDAFLLALSGAYQNVLAHVYAGTAGPEMPERVVWLFAKQLGYTKKDFNKVIKYVNNFQGSTGG